MTKYLTVITFDGTTSKLIGDTRYQVMVEGIVPNLQIGQIFIFDHPKMQMGRSGYVRNIQTNVDLDHLVTQYIDVGSEKS